MKPSCVLAVGACGLIAAQAFVFSPAVPSASYRPAPRRQEQARMVARAAEAAATAGAGAVDTDGPSEEKKERVWDMTSWPARSEEYNKMPSDARNWEVQNERLEVWEDAPNPVEELTGRDWYEQFAPSDVEIEAAEMGFDWTDQWFEDNGITRTDLPEEGDKK